MTRINHTERAKNRLFTSRARLLAAGATVVYATLLASPVSGQWAACSGGSTTCTSSKVGIGTTTPGAILDIWGNGTDIRANLFSGNAANQAFFAVGRTSYDLAIGAAGTAGDFFNDTTPGTAVIKSNWEPIMIGSGDDHPTITITNGNQVPGQVGIATVSPISTLTILSSATDGAATYGNGITFVNNAGSTANTPWTHAGIWSQGSGGFNGSLVFGTDGDGADDTTGISERMRISANGNVGIGTTNPQYPLSVNGIIQAKEVIVNTGWSDYVFAPSYHLRSLEETAAYIQQNHHLPEIPSEAEITQHGASVGEIESKLLAKVEELTLQMIRLNEENKRLVQELRERKAK